MQNSCGRWTRSIASLLHGVDASATSRRTAADATGWFAAGRPRLRDREYLQQLEARR